jgi:hypothetical protein
MSKPPGPTTPLSLSLRDCAPHTRPCHHSFSARPVPPQPRHHPHPLDLTPNLILPWPTFSLLSNPYSQPRCTPPAPSCRRTTRPHLSLLNPLHRRLPPLLTGAPSLSLLLLLHRTHDGGGRRTRISSPQRQTVCADPTPPGLDPTADAPPGGRCFRWGLPATASGEGDGDRRGVDLGFSPSTPLSSPPGSDPAAEVPSGGGDIGSGGGGNSDRGCFRRWASGGHKQRRRCLSLSHTHLHPSLSSGCGLAAEPDEEHCSGPSVVALRDWPLPFFPDQRPSHPLLPSAGCCTCGRRRRWHRWSPSPPIPRRMAGVDGGGGRSS